MIEIAKDGREFPGIYRTNAIGALGKIGATEAVPTLNGLLNSENKQYARQALDGLERIGTAEANVAVNRYKHELRSER